MQNRTSRFISFEDIKTLIGKANHIAITTHVHPDGDALGSVLAMYEHLVMLGKKTRIIIDDKIPAKFLSLPYMDKVESSLEVAIEALDMVIVLDVSNAPRIAMDIERISSPILCIDHHVSNGKYADYLYLDIEAAATGEILSHYFLKTMQEVRPSMANALYMALATDTGFFKYANVTASTMQAAAWCMEKGATPVSISNLLDTMTSERLQAIALSIDSMEFLADGKVAIMGVDASIMKLVDGDTDGFVDYARNVEGVDIAVLLKEYDRDITRVSFRANTSDVNYIAATYFGGGGHIKAAGCTIELPFLEAKAKVCKVLEEYIRGHI